MRQFVKAFYDFWNSPEGLKRPQLVNLYHEKATLHFRGHQVKYGGLQTFFRSKTLPESDFKVEAWDCQALAGNFHATADITEAHDVASHLSVNGTVSFLEKKKGEPKRKKYYFFHQTFLMVVIGDTWKIVSDVIRIRPQPVRRRVNRGGFSGGRGGGRGGFSGGRGGYHSSKRGGYNNNNSKNDRYDDYGSSSSSKGSSGYGRGQSRRY